MALYRELSVAAQTAYAELQELVQVAEATRSPASLTGKVGWKTIKGRRYAYWQFKEIDGRKREYYLGPEGPAIAAIERARGRPVPALEAVLRDPSEELRGQAAWALGTIEPPSAPASLIAALKDASPQVRVRAAWALGRIEDGAAASALLPLLKDSDPEVRKAAFWALGAIGGDAAQPALIEALRDPDPDIRAAAARALAGGHQSPWPWPMPRPIIK